MKESLLLPEQTVSLNQRELQILLVDLHGRLADVLTYQQAVGSVPFFPWLHRRITTLKNLTAKLEEAFNAIETNEKETNEKDTSPP